MLDSRGMKKIIIHCASGINNIGDEAILDVMVKYVQEFGDISVISLNAKNTRKFHPDIQAVNDFSLSALKLIKDCDLFILGGVAYFRMKLQLSILADG